jgi:hypothetical protein
MRWDVRWVAKDKRGRWRIIVKEYGDDLQAAVLFYTRVMAAGKHFPTLRCRNSGFPPPEELRPRWKKKKVKEQVKLKRRGKTYTKTRIVYKDVYLNPMKRRNGEGTWWCPYCRELREFVEGYNLPYAHPPMKALEGFGDARPRPDDGSLYCPMCFVNTKNYHVRKWNPLAERFG